MLELWGPSLSSVALPKRKKERKKRKEKKRALIDDERDVTCRIQASLFVIGRATSAKIKMGGGNDLSLTPLLLARGGAFPMLIDNCASRGSTDVVECGGLPSSDTYLLIPARGTHPS